MTVRELVTYIRGRDDISYRHLADTAGMGYKNLLAHLRRTDGMSLSVSQLVKIAEHNNLQILIVGLREGEEFVLDGQNEVDTEGYLNGFYIGNDKK